MTSMNATTVSAPTKNPASFLHFEVLFLRFTFVLLMIAILIFDSHLFTMVKGDFDVRC
jgi:hypothetical protein